MKRLRDLRNGWTWGSFTAGTASGPETRDGWISPCRRFAVSTFDRPTLGPAAKLSPGYRLTHLPSGLAVAACPDAEPLLWIAERLSDPVWSFPPETLSLAHRRRMAADLEALCSLADPARGLQIALPGTTWTASGRPGDGSWLPELP